MDYLELEHKLEEYKHVNGKEKRVLWWEIRQMIKDSPKAYQMKIYRHAHPDMYLEHWKRQKDKYQLLKLEILAHYGKGECACVRCGEERIVCLTIDHIEGRGNRHRQGKLRTTPMFYRWLQNNNYPTEYQTLCMNCQFEKRFKNKEFGKYASAPIDWQTEV